MEVLPQWFKVLSNDRVFSPKLEKFLFFKKQFIFITGVENFKAKQITQILLQDESIIGIPTNWKIEDFDFEIRKKFTPLMLSDIVSYFNNLCNKLW